MLKCNFSVLVAMRGTDEDVGCTFHHTTELPFMPATGQVFSPSHDEAMDFTANWVSGYDMETRSVSVQATIWVDSEAAMESFRYRFLSIDWIELKEGEGPTYRPSSN